MDELDEWLSGKAESNPEPNVGIASVPSAASLAAVKYTGKQGLSAVDAAPNRTADLRTNPEDLPPTFESLEKIAFEFERTDADDNSKLRRLLREIGQVETQDDGPPAFITKDRVSEVTDDELVDFARKLRWPTQPFSRLLALFTRQ